MRAHHLVALLFPLLIAGSALAQPTTPQPTTPQPPTPRTSPRRVHIGVYAFRVGDLDLTRNSYLVDFWVWFRWRDADIDPSQSFEFMNDHEGWNSIIEYRHVDEAGKPRPTRLDGWLYQRVHVQGHFQRPFDLQGYPFDRQKLDIVIEETQHTLDEIVYIPRTGGETYDRSLRIPGWRVDGVRLRATTSLYRTNFGDPFHPARTQRATRLIYRMFITRPAGSYMMLTFLPITMVMLITFVVFLIPLRYFEGRLGLGITALISAVALQLTSSGDLPITDYLVLIDYVYDLSYVVIFVASVESVISVRLHDTGRESMARKLDRGFLIGSAVAYFGTVMALIARAIWG